MHPLCGRIFAFLPAEFMPSAELRVKFGEQGAEIIFCIV